MIKTASWLHRQNYSTVIMQIDVGLHKKYRQKRHLLMPFYDSGNIACDISGITTKAPHEAVLTVERHVHIEAADYIMCIFVLFSCFL